MYIVRNRMDLTDFQMPVGSLQRCGIQRIQLVMTCELHDKWLFRQTRYFRAGTSMFLYL